MASVPDVEPGLDGEWSAPSPLGFPGAADSAGSIAAALLAGFSLTLIGLVVPDTTRFRMPGLALSLLAFAAVLFVGAVQCAFWAREYAITPDDLKMWHPDMSRSEAVRIQKVHSMNFLVWTRRMNWAYRFGILFLLAGAAVTLVPSGAAGIGRQAAIAILSLGFILELLWIAAGWILEGSPSMGFTYRDDAPIASVRFTRLRSSKPLRRCARIFIPYARLPPT